MPSTYLIDTISSMTESFSSVVYTFHCNPRLYSLFMQELPRPLCIEQNYSYIFYTNYFIYIQRIDIISFSKKVSI